MQITRLEIFGFKSFVDRFVLNLDRKLVGIVGPNGCGKSNIVDALRWVLGETSAKQLRGGVLEDLIFNGSDARRPLGMCEVTVTLSSSSKELRHNLTVITGGNNGEDVQHEETGSVEVEELVADEVQDNICRGEVCSPLVAAEVKDNKSEANEILTSRIANIPGLFDATEIQLTRRLYRSGESEYFINKVPCRLGDMVEFYRLVGLGARGLSIVQQGQISQIISKKPIERRELLEEAAGISGFRARIEIAQRKLEKTAQNLLRITDIVTEVEKQVRSLKKQANRAEQRAELKARLKELEFFIFNAETAGLVINGREYQNQISSLDAEIEEVQNSLLVLSAESERIRADLHTSDVEIVQLRTQNDALLQKLNAEKQKETQIKIEVTRVGEQITSICQQLDRLQNRRNVIGEEVLQGEGNWVSFAQELERLGNKRAEVEQELTRASDNNENDADGAEILKQQEAIREVTARSEKFFNVTDELRQAESDVISLRRSHKDNQNKRNAKQLQLARLESEISTLNVQLDEMASTVAKYLDIDAGAAGGGKVLLAGIVAPEEYQTALSAVLGEKANFLVHASPKTYAEKYSLHKAGNNKPAKLGVLNSEYKNNQPGTVSLTQDELNIAPSAKLLLKTLQVEDGLMNILQPFLGHIIVVDSLTEAIALQEFRQAGTTDVNQNHTWFVTKAGEVVTDWGWFTTEGKGLALSFTRRIKERSEEAAVLSEEIVFLDQVLSKNDEEIKKFDAKIRELKTYREQSIECQRELNQLLNQARQMEKQVQERRFHAERAVQGELRRIISEISSLESKQEYERKKLGSLAQEQQRLDIEEAELNQRAETLRRESLQLENSLNDFKLTHEGAESEFMQLQAQYHVQQGKIKELENQRGFMVSALADKTQTAEEHRRKSNGLLKKQNELKLTVEKDNLTLSMMHEEIERHYPQQLSIFTLDEALAFVGTANAASADGDVGAGFARPLETRVDEAKREKQQLRSRIEREGEVDSSTIELYRTEKERLDSMVQQSRDLEGAKKTLEDTIRKLKEISKAQFMETFDFVSKKFEQLIPQLFGGGSGHLTLINPEDPLTSGVEISVRPPGKKLKSLDLMSGGEKALSAVGLLFSVFLYKPNPICVLDEVDAPLDDANLSRFLEMIHTISKETQFLLITHNKQTMLAVDRLIGITMQEKGISTALSVSLDQADDFLAEVA